MIQAYKNLKYYPKAGFGAFRAKGLAPIVVIDTKHDPVAPHRRTEAIHKTLENSVLLTWEDDGHMTYRRSGTCIKNQVNAYLLTDRVPKDGLVCPVEQKQGQR